MILANGYETKTTFWQDFSIADAFGKNAIQDTYNRAFKEWKNDIVYITEMALVLNLKLWYWYDNGNEDLAELYQKLWYDIEDYVYGDHSNFSEDDLSYYYHITD